MSTAIHDFFTSELKLFPSNYDITVVSDNAKPLPSFEYKKGCPSLKRSHRSAPTLGSNKKDYRWGETPSLNFQWDSAPTAYARHTVPRPELADCGSAPDTSCSNEEVPLLSPVKNACCFSLNSSAVRDISSSTMAVKERLTLEVLADQAILTGTSHVYRHGVSQASQTVTRNSTMVDRPYPSSSMSSLHAPSDEAWRSDELPKYMCDKRKDNIINIVKQLGRLATVEIKQKGANGPPQQPRRQRSSLNPKAA
jgi:hypothetical protein